MSKNSSRTDYKNRRITRITMMDPWAGVALSTGMIIFIFGLILFGVFFKEIKSWCCPIYDTLDETNSEQTNQTTSQTRFFRFFKR